MKTLLYSHAAVSPHIDLCASFILGWKTQFCFSRYNHVYSCTNALGLFSSLFSPVSTLSSSTTVFQRLEQLNQYPDFNNYLIFVLTKLKSEGKLPHPAAPVPFSCRGSCDGARRHISDVSFLCNRSVTGPFGRDSCDHWWHACRKWCGTQNMGHSNFKPISWHPSTLGSTVHSRWPVALRHFMPQCLEAWAAKIKIL